MSGRLYDFGRSGFTDAINWLTDTIKAVQLQLDGALTDVGIKAVTGATNASPIVITSTSHGFANNDIVVIRGVLGNTAANGTWQIANVAANTFEIKTLTFQNLNSTGNAAYTSGGCAINLSIADLLDDISAARVGSDTAAFTAKTNTAGVLDAADLSFSGVTGTIHGLAIYKDAGTEATDPVIFFFDGKTQVVVAADAATSATTVWVEQLEGPIASGTAIIFSNGVTATLSAGAAAGARSLTVTALSAGIVAGHTGDAQTTGSGLPITLTSGAYSIAWDNGPNKILKI